MPVHLAYQISGWYIYFLQRYSPKHYPLKTLFFQTAILSISRYHKEIKMTFLESWDQTGSKSHIFIRQNRKFDLMWPRVDRLFSVVDLHGIRLQKGFDFWMLHTKVTINHVPHARKRILNFCDFSWPFVTWPWRWPILSMSLMLTQYLH